MRGAAGGQSSSYEVRCPRCNVSFPIETRRCIHCGGATAAAPPTLSAGTSPGPIESGGGGLFGGGRGGTGSPTATDPFARGGPYSRTDAPPSASAPFPPGDLDAAEPDEPGATSWGVSLLRSFGSLIWIAALVAFSMLRNCQSEG